MDQQCLDNYLTLQKCEISNLGNSIYNDLAMGRRCEESKIEDWRLAVAMHSLMCGHQLSDTNCLSEDKACDIIYYLNNILDVCDC